MFMFKFVLAKAEYGNDGKWSFLLTLNGVLAGMVAQCAGCDEYAPWGALIVGSFGGLAFIACHIGMLICKLDDPLDAVGVHGGGGNAICCNLYNYMLYLTNFILKTSKLFECK